MLSYQEIERCINSLGEKFLKWPYKFFTESDAHSFLYYYIFRSGPKALKIQYPTKDSIIKTVLIHREYPTSFRYRKDGMQLDNTGGRGHYDLVVLHPTFLKEHSIDEVIAKRYKSLPKTEGAHLLASIEFKLIVGPLSKAMKNEIEKDFKKLSWSVELGQALNSYMIVFNRYRPEAGFYKLFESFGAANPQVKGIYIESIIKPKRSYQHLYTGDWSIRSRFEQQPKGDQ